MTEPMLLLRYWRNTNIDRAAAINLSSGSIRRVVNFKLFHSLEWSTGHLY